ncbi:MAG TPA: Wzz/FepE/Etk N-terminal domain-containing protein [Candidatus Krumholzibacteria bacterium]|nr:Wzz/FepE/Etk N-terminal domain-containing protein [Candidatus Krumholzibacteria bacterium]HPD70793.1 Wzz/FepE/Etk N-terminal domain-containing protein [Candidatus Krumholzibacteria bacterium]HRY39507.1 Wzz/FepE/Etk N-terminal domain-containing protein [Candidatus Krumholzibacteria bacterium]
MVDIHHPVAHQTEERMDMRSLMEVLIRRRWIILSVALPVVLVAVIGTMRSTQMYRARTTLMIEVSSPANTSFYRPAPNYDVVLAAAAELGMSAPVAMEAARALIDSLPSFRERMPKYLGPVQTLADLQGVIHGGANCSHVGESNLLNLSFSHPDPQFAIIGAAALAQAFIEFNISTKRNSPAVSYFTEQISVTQAEIDSLMAVRTAILDGTGMLGLAADLRVSFAQIRDLESQYFAARSRREGLEARLLGLKAAVAKDPDFVPSVSFNDAGSLFRLKGELDDQLTKLAALRLRYTDDSNFVQRALDQIEAARTELTKERARYVESLEIELAQARGVEESLRSAQIAQEHSLNEYPDINGRIEVLDLQIDGLKKLLQNLQFKRGEVRMSSDSDLRVSDVLLIEEPVMDVPVGRGRKMLYLIISVVLAIAMGLVAAFFVESNDHRIYDRRRAELYLEVPVLGSLPDTTTKTRA